MTSPDPPGGYIEHLRSLSDHQLVELLGEQWLATGPPIPQTFEALAAVLVRQQNGRIGTLTTELNRFEDEVVDALEVIGAPISFSALLARLGPSCDPAALRQAVDRFRAHGLMWGDDDELCLLSAYLDKDRRRGGFTSRLGIRLEKALGAYGAEQLAPLLAKYGTESTSAEDDIRQVVAALCDPRVVVDLATDLREPARALLNRLATGDWPHLYLYGGRADLLDELGVQGDGLEFVRPLIEHGLLVIIGGPDQPPDLHAEPVHLELPREIAMILRGDSPFGTLHPCPPPLQMQTVGAAQADEAGARQAFTALTLMRRLLEHCADEPVTNQQWRQIPHSYDLTEHQGINDDDLGRLAQALEAPEDVVVLLLEVAAAAGLLALTPDLELWMPTPGYDSWNESSPAAQWFAIAEAWLQMERVAGSHAEPDFNTVSSDVLANQPLGHPEERRRPLDVLATLPIDQGTSTDSILELLAWQRPGNTVRRHDKARWSLGEAELLGVTALGCLTGFGRHLLSGQRSYQRLDQLLPTVLPAQRGRAGGAAAIADLAARRRHAVRRTPVRQEQPYRHHRIFLPTAAERALIVHALRHSDRHPDPPSREPRRIKLLREVISEPFARHEPVVLSIEDDQEGRFYNVTAVPLLITGGVLLGRDHVDELTFTVPLAWVKAARKPTEKQRAAYDNYQLRRHREERDPRRPRRPMEESVEDALDSVAFWTWRRAANPEAHTNE